MGWGLALLGLGVGMGLAVVGGGLGIGRLSASALEGSARQPEMLGTLRNTAIVFAALIEAFTFLVIILTFVLAGQAMKKEEAPAGGTKTPAVAPENPGK
jgi:F-type H+-transporting ATPase subunit c